MKLKPTRGGVFFALLLILSTNLMAQLGEADPTCTYDPDEPVDQLFPFDQFMGINLLRDNPIEEAHCVGFVREYHSWNIDEGNVLIAHPDTDELGSQPYPNQLFRWNPVYQNTTPTQFDNFYEILQQQELGINAAMMNTPYVYGGINDHPEWPVSADFNRRDYLDIPPLFHLWNENTGRYEIDNCNTIPGSPNPNFPTVDDCPNDAEDPESYVEYADWITQYTARYGIGMGVADQNLKFHPEETLLTGQNLVQYIEIWNEQDKDFHANANDLDPDVDVPQFSPEAYAAMASAAFDGNSTNTDFAFQAQRSDGVMYDVGVATSVGTQFAMGGLVEIDLDYVNAIAQTLQDLRGGTIDEAFIFDVINFHHYSYIDDDNGGNNGIQDGWWISPEEDQLRCRLLNAIDECAGMEINVATREFWLSEFGYDDAQFTRENGNGPDIPLLNPAVAYNSVADYQTAGVDEARQTVANWTVRAFMEIAAAGFDRAMVYWLRDEPDAAELGAWDIHCGLLDANENRKLSWWYVASLKNILAGKTFGFQRILENPATGTSSTGFEGFAAGEDPDFDFPRIYRFDEGIFDPTDAGTFTWAVWSPTSNNSSYNIPGFELATPLENDPGQVTLIRLEEGSTSGVIELVDTYTVGNNVFVNIPVSETPVFIIEEPRQPPLCPENFSHDFTCNSITVEWEIPDGQQYDHYNIWFNTDGDPNGSTMTLASGDHPGMATSFTLSGLAPGQTYWVYVIPQNELNTQDIFGIPADENGAPIWCVAAEAVNLAEAPDEDFCSLPTSFGTFVSGTCPCNGICKTESWDPGYDDDAEYINRIFTYQDINPCEPSGANPQLSDDENTLHWVCYENESTSMEMVFDLVVLQDVFSFDVFVGNGTGSAVIDFSHAPTADGPWTVFGTQNLTTGDGWVSITDLNSPVGGVQFLRVRSHQVEGNQVHIYKVLGCGDISSIPPPIEVNVSTNCDGMKFNWDYPIDQWPGAEFRVFFQNQTSANEPDATAIELDLPIDFQCFDTPGDQWFCNSNFSGIFECGTDYTIFIQAFTLEPNAQSDWVSINVSTTSCEDCEDNLCGCEETELSIYESNPEGELIKPASEPTGPAALFDEEVGEPFCDFPEAPQNGWQLTTPYQTEYAVLDLGYEAHLKDLTLYAGKGRGALHIAPGSPGNFRDYFIHVSRQDYHPAEWLTYRDLNVRTRYLLLRLEGAAPNFGELRVCTNKLAEPVRDPNLYVSGVSCESLQVTVGNLGKEEYTAVQLYYSAQGGYTGIGHPHQSNADARSAVAYFGANGSAELRLPYLRPDIEYHFAYRLLTASGHRSAYIYPGQTGRTANCKEEEFFSDSGVLLDEECRLTGLQWSYDLSEHPGHFELIEANAFSEDPTLVAQTNTEIGKNETGQYRFELSSTPKGRYPYVYLRYVSYRGTSSPWYVWDTSIAPCGETRGRTSGYFGAALSGAVVVAEGFRIHPNPTDDLLYLTADSRRFTQYAIIDALGSTLLSGPVDATVRTMKLPTADLTPGIYFLQLRGRKTRWQSLRFVVVK